MPQNNPKPPEPFETGHCARCAGLKAPMANPKQEPLKCGHPGVDWNDEGDCIRCARNKLLGDPKQVKPDSLNIQREDVKQEAELEDKLHEILSHFEVTVPELGDVGLYDLCHPRIKDKYGNSVEWALVMAEEILAAINTHTTKLLNEQLHRIINDTEN